MKYIKLSLIFVLFTFFFLFVDYVLPKNEVMRVTDSYSRITEIGKNRMFFAQEDIVGGGDTSTDTKRDVRFMSSVSPSGKTKIYRNEDTGWVWPPYFKYDSATLQGDIAALASTEDSPKWVMVTSYGWRISWMSIFPNVVGVKRIEDPNASTVSISGLLVLSAMFAFTLFLNRGYNRFYNRSITPKIREIDERTDAFRRDISETAQKRTKGTRDWFNTWKGVPRK